MAIGLLFRNVKKEEIQARVPEALDLVGLGEYEERKAGTLSGGEMQRVALARAISTRPEILLLDEPTANLDPVSTEKIESLVSALKERFGITVVLSTHDMIQGQRLADRIAVVIDGRIGQVGTSKDIFYHPMNRAVATMVGVENIFEGVVATNEGGLASIDVNGSSIIATTPLPKVLGYALHASRGYHIPRQRRGKKQRPERVYRAHYKGPPDGTECQAEDRCRDQTDRRDHPAVIRRTRPGHWQEIGLAFKASAIHVVENKA